MGELSLRKKALFYGVLLAILGVILLGLEGLCRLAFPQLAETYYVRVDPETGLGYTGGHVLRLNRWRMRELDFPVERPADERRILCLGDSITQGYGSAFEDSWPKVLERLLPPQADRRRQFCVNAAGTGATTHRQLQFYQDTARQFGADVVVVGFCLNDVRLEQVMSDVGEQSQTRGKLAKSIEWRSSLRRSYLFAGVDRAVTELTKRYIMPLAGHSWIQAYPYQVNAFGITPHSDQAWQDTAASIAGLARETEAQGARLLLVAFPYQFQVSDDERDNPYGVDKSSFIIDPFVRLAEISRQNGIPFVSLQPAFAGQRQRMLQGEIPWDPLYVDFCHPNQRGQQLAAEQVLAALQREGWVE